MHKWIKGCWRRKANKTGWNMPIIFNFISLLNSFAFHKPFSFLFRKIFIHKFFNNTFASSIIFIWFINNGNKMWKLQNIKNKRLRKIGSFVYFFTKGIENKKKEKRNKICIFSLQYNISYNAFKYNPNIQHSLFEISIK